MKVIVAGSRNLNDYSVVRDYLDKVLCNQKSIEIVSGTANGADKLGERYAIEKGHPLTKFAADWDTHGKKAGPMRNGVMAAYADALVAFWDGKSPGTKSMIDLAKANHLLTRVKFI